MYQTFFKNLSKICYLIIVIASLQALLTSSIQAIDKIDREAIKDVFATSRTITSKMLLKVLERDFKSNQEIEYKIFEDGIVIKSNIYDADATKLFDTKIARISTTKVKTTQDFVKELRQTKFGNTFPWFENLKDKGNVVQIEFANNFTLDCFDQKTCPSVELPATFIYYTKHPDNPLVFREILKFVKML